MVSKEALIECFQDTINQCNNNSKLKMLTDEAKRSTVVYGGNIHIENKILPLPDANVEVVEGTTFDVAKRYAAKGKKVAVLNFANPHNPGGGVERGAMAQEECLCRSSNLYQCLTLVTANLEYYEYNIKYTDYFFSDRILYSDRITVFKDDSIVPVMLPEEEWFTVSVLTCAAPYMGKRTDIDYERLKRVFKGRIRNIFEVALDNNVDTLILGAFGCGAFKNPPRLVAEAFDEVMQEKYKGLFSNIIFAIKKTSLNCPNYNAFKEVFVHYMTENGKTKEQYDNGEIEDLTKEYDNQNGYNRRKRYISILGDSISTFKGYNPVDYKVFYEENNCMRADIKDTLNTWWGQVIQKLNGELLVNNSWSGSRVTKLPGSTNVFPSACSEERTCGLHIECADSCYMPDDIIIFLGVNDWSFAAKHGDIDDHPDDNEYFGTAYRLMLSRIKFNYPKSRIWCCTLCSTYMSDNQNFEFPEVLNGNDINYYNYTISKVAHDMGCNVIDLYSYNTPYDTIDGTHPNKSGMNTIADLVVREMIKNDNYYLDEKCDEEIKENSIKKISSKYSDLVKVDEDFELIQVLNNEEERKAFIIVHHELGEVCKLIMLDKDSYRTKYAYTNENKMIKINDFSNPLFINIYRAGCTDKYIYFICDDIDAEYLYKIRQKNNGRLKVNEVIDIALQVCEGLEYLNSLNPPMKYWNLNPGRIFITDNNKVKLDYVAEMLDYMYDNDTKFFEEYHGRYYAPEQRYITDYVDERADIYSMGRIMYELLAGYENCDKYNIELYIEKLDKEILDMLKRIIEKCIKHDPTERFQTFMELKEALCKCNNIIKFF